MSNNANLLAIDSSLVSLDERMQNLENQTKLLTTSIQQGLVAMSIFIAMVIILSNLIIK